MLETSRPVTASSAASPARAREAGCGIEKGRGGEGSQTGLDEEKDLDMQRY